MFSGVSDFSCKYTHGTSTVGGRGKATVRTTVRTDHEIVYAVPRVLTVSVEWFRILSELSGYVWFTLIVISLL